jgi:RND family efflux transporter MFP subunit
VPAPSPERLRRAEQQLAGVGLPEEARHVEYVVAQRMVSEGEMVRAFPSVAAFRLVLDRPLKLVAPVPERHLGEVKVGQPVGFVVEAFPKEVFEGTVVRVSPTVDEVNRTFAVEIHVPNAARRLKAGSFAKAAVRTRQDSQALTVPEEALVTFAGVTKVFVVEDGKARAVPVKTGERLETQSGGRSAGWVEIVGDLRPGSQVVTSGFSQLAEGTPVRIRPAAEEIERRGKRP